MYWTLYAESKKNKTNCEYNKKEATDTGKN